jgi:hypothetical protein
MSNRNFYTEDPKFMEESDDNGPLKYLGALCVGILCVIFLSAIILSFFNHNHHG